MIINFIKEYQSLLGSFIALSGSLFIFWLSTVINKRKEIKNSKAEVEKIFLMAIREFTSSFLDLEMYFNYTKKNFNKDSKKIDIFLTPKFNKIFINEERLFSISKNLHFINSQQVDIAVSAIKKFNGYLNQFEEMPKNIFDYNIRCLQTGLQTKEKALEDFKDGWSNYLKSIADCLNNDMPILRKHLLRPIVMQKYTIKQINEFIRTGVDIDKKLDDDAEFISALENNFQDL